MYADKHVPLDQVIFEAIVGAYRRQRANEEVRNRKRQGRKKKYLPLGPRETAQHHIAGGEHPAYPKRCPVPDSKCSWTVPFDDYAPVFFEAPSVLKNAVGLPTGGKWADPPDLTRAGLERRVSYAGDGEPKALRLDGAGAPTNPVGRTGLSGRGLLGKWGPNHAADPIVTRWHPRHYGVLQMVAIKRRDTGDWAIPGGMVDPGEHVSMTVRREFTEEAGNFPEPARARRFEALTDELFANGRVVFQGYVDDPRNTDHAWMETVAFHFHCNEELATMLPLKAGDDAGQASHLVSNRLSSSLTASHRLLLLTPSRPFGAGLVARRQRGHRAALPRPVRVAPRVGRPDR